MAKGAYIGVDGVARKIKPPYAEVGGVARKSKTGYIGVDNVARECFSSGTPIGNLAVRTTVYMAVDGVPTAFVIVNQGLPNSADYDGSCDGTWLLMKDIHALQIFGSSNDYASSNIHKYLNDTFIKLLDDNAAGLIKQVVLPYTKGMGIMGTYCTGANGLSAKAFLLSRGEVFESDTDLSNNEGFVLSNFVGVNNNARRAKFDGGYYAWGLRSPNIDEAMYNCSITDLGTSDNYRHVSVEVGVRPAVIVPRDTLVDRNFNIIA